MIPFTHVTLSGLANGDPFKGPGHRMVVRFSVVVAKKYRIGKEWHESKLVMVVECYAPLAQRVLDMVRSGYPVVVTGELAQRFWKSRTGAELNAHILIAEQVLVGTPVSQKEVESFMGVNLPSTDPEPEVV